MYVCVLGSTQPLQLLEELDRYEKMSNTSEHDRLTQEIKKAYGHWLLRFPSQCVLTSEAILWERSIFKSLERQERDELKAHRSVSCAFKIPSKS